MHAINVKRFCYVSMEELFIDCSPNKSSNTPKPPFA